MITFSQARNYPAFCDTFVLKLKYIPLYHHHNKIGYRISPLINKMALLDSL